MNKYAEYLNYQNSNNFLPFCASIIYWSLQKTWINYFVGYMHLPFLGHLSHSGDIAMGRVLSFLSTSSSQELLD